MRLVVTREDYFEDALEALGERGHAALKVSDISRRIGVTTGSFYNYFGSLDGFVSELLAYWEHQQTERLIAVALEQLDARSQVRRLKELAMVELRNRSERAIRAWATVNPDVALTQHRVDTRRLDAMRRIYSRLIPSEAEVELLAQMGLTLVAGHQALRPGDNALLARLLDEYQAIIFRHADAAGPSN